MLRTFKRVAYRTIAVIRKHGVKGFFSKFNTNLSTYITTRVATWKVGFYKSFFSKIGKKEHDTYFIPDVFLISHPKAGRTWIRVMLAKILSEEGGNPKRLEMIRYRHDGSDKVSKFKDKSLNSIDKWKSNRIILLIRDPRDIAVSFYFHVTKRDKRHYNYNGTISEFIRDENYGVNYIIDFYNNWYKNRDRVEDFLIVRYEDLKNNTKKVLVRICEFIGIMDEIEEIDLTRVVDYASFEKMRKLEVSGKQILSNESALRVVNPDDPESFKARRGKIGGYKDYLNEKDIEFVNEQMERLNSNFGYDV